MLLKTALLKKKKINSMIGFNIFHIAETVNYIISIPLLKATPNENEMRY